jgi:hypothetical protein
MFEKGVKKKEAGLTLPPDTTAPFRARLEREFTGG